MSGAEAAEHERRDQVESALGGADTPAAIAQVSACEGSKSPPRRMRPKPTVVRTYKLRWWQLLLWAVFVLSDLVGSFFDWLVEKVTFNFRRRRTLRGGWRSDAGSLLAAVDAPVRTLLVVGREGLHVVYVGELGTEVGRTLPRAKVTGVEQPSPEKGRQMRAKLGFHFADGSWCRLFFPDASWQRIAEQFPQTSGKRS